MKSKLLITLILVAGFLIFGFSVNQVYGQTPENKSIKAPVVEYTCPKHPEVIQKLPGNCPICGATLVEKKKESKTGTGKMNRNHKLMAQDSVKTKKV
jgi:hypothetical protein